MPEIFFKNYKVLQHLLQIIKWYGGVNNNMHTRAISLSKKYNHIINELLVKALSKRKTALSDYLKQSRYGQVISNDKLLSSVNKYND